MTKGSRHLQGKKHRANTNNKAAEKIGVTWPNSRVSAVSSDNRTQLHSAKSVQSAVATTLNCTQPSQCSQQ